jgi:hypothetical protein
MFGDKYREILLSRYAADHILSDKSFKDGKKTAFVRTSSSEQFHNMRETENLGFENIVFLTDTKNARLTDSFDKLTLYDDTVEAIFTAYAANINFEHMPPPANFGASSKNAADSGINLNVMQSMLSAA